MGINVMLIINKRNFPMQFILVRKSEAYILCMCDILNMFASVIATFKWAICMPFICLAES